MDASVFLRKIENDVIAEASCGVFFSGEIPRLESRSVKISKDWSKISGGGR